MGKEDSTTKGSGSPRFVLVVSGAVEILLAFFLVSWGSEASGILYWVKDLIFTLLMLFGILSIKDGLWGSNGFLRKVTNGGDRNDFEPKKHNRVIEKLKRINDEYPGVFAVAVIIFSILYFSNIYVPGKEIVEGILLITIIVLGIPVLIFW